MIEALNAQERNSRSGWMTEHFCRLDKGPADAFGDAAAIEKDLPEGC